MNPATWPWVASSRLYTVGCFVHTNYNTNLLPCGHRLPPCRAPTAGGPGCGAEGKGTVYLPVFRLGSSVALSAVFEPVGDLCGGEARRFGQLPLLPG